MTRWTRIAAVAPFAVLLLVAAAPARADDCPLLDVCSVDDAVGDTVDTVSGTVDTVTDTTSDATDPVRNAVQGVLGGGGEETPRPDEGNGGGGHGSGSADVAGRHDRAQPRGQNGGERVASPTDRLNAARLPLGHVTQGSEATSMDVAVDPPDRSLRDRLAAVAADAAKGIATVLVLLGVVVAFVMVQDRLDKKDPKLALAPARSDDVRFG